MAIFHSIYLLTSPSPTPLNKVAVYFYTRDPEGDLEPGVEVSYRMTRAPVGVGNSYDNTVVTHPSDGAALWEVNLRDGAEYEFWRGAGRVQKCRVVDNGAGRMLLTNFIGSP